MVGLVPVPFAVLLRRLAAEGRRGGSVYGLPATSWWVPAPGLDLSATLPGGPAATPVGPADGPQTQLAANVVVAWLAGGRVVELRTVEEGARSPAAARTIHAAGAVLRTEGGAGLEPEAALREYAKAACLVEVLRATRAFGRLDASALDTLFDAGVRGDLEGISSPAVQGFLDGLADPTALYDELREEVPDDLAAWRDLSPPVPLASSITFEPSRGCPGDEVEPVLRHLMTRGLAVWLKLSPALLGREAVEELLHRRLGYRQLALLPDAFDDGLAWDETVPLIERLRETSRATGVPFGVKLARPLPVRRDPALFPSATGTALELSGPPLHLLALALLERLRAAVGPDLPVSFSAGADAGNLADTLACGVAPVTLGEDLLKPGGAGRLALALRALEAAMSAAGARTLPELLRAAPRDAGAFAAAVAASPRYRAAAAGGAPGEEAASLPVHDCSGCDVCLSVCPNAAFFTYRSEPVEVVTVLATAAPGGRVTLGPGRGFVIRGSEQTAVVADLCDDCGSCVPFCPEEGEPQHVKERVFLGLGAWEALPPRDGYLREGNGLRARLRGVELRFVPDPANDRAVVSGGGLELLFTLSGLELLEARSGRPGASFDTADAWLMRMVWRGLLESEAPSWVDPDPARAEVRV